MNDLSVISARRSYEFAQDAIRLTLLSSQPVVAFIKQMFQFEVGSVGTPMETFGPMASTIPPGLFFDYGISPVPEGNGTAIRYLHFEQRRIVIDVAGPTSTLDSTFSTLCQNLADLRTSEGYPAIGEPVETRDYSEIRLAMDLDPRQLVPSTILDEAEKTFGREATDRLLMPVLTLRMQADGEYLGGSVPIVDTYTLDIRAGTSVADRIYYSAGPMDSESHINFLAKIEKVLSS
jgi:hypothetical protein